MLLCSESRVSITTMKDRIKAAKLIDKSNNVVEIKDDSLNKNGKGDKEVTKKRIIYTKV